MLTRPWIGRMTLAMLLLIMLLPILTACATTTGSSAQVDYGLCDDPRTPEKWDGLLQPTYWRDSWPDDAIIKAKSDNAQGVALCGSEWGR